MTGADIRRLEGWTGNQLGYAVKRLRGRLLARPDGNRVIYALTEQADALAGAPKRKTAAGDTSWLVDYLREHGPTDSLRLMSFTGKAYHQLRQAANALGSQIERTRGKCIVWSLAPR